MENNNENQKNINVEQFELSSEKSLEELLLENDYKFEPKEIDNLVNNVAYIKEFNSASSAKEYIKYLLSNGKDINKFLKDNQSDLQNNYHKKILDTLKKRMVEEQESYSEIIAPFVDEKNIEKNFSLFENLTLEFYKFLGDVNKFEKKYTSIKEKNLLLSFQRSKDGLKGQLTKSDRLKTNYSEKTNYIKSKVSNLITSLNKIGSDVEFTKSALSKLESEKLELEKEVNSNSDNYELLSKIKTDYTNLKNDIKILEENALKSLDDSDQIKLKLIDYKINLQESEQLELFYSDMFQTYKRRIENISDLMIKIDEGMSFTTAYDQAKLFIEKDAPFIKFDEIRKEQYVKNNSEILRLKLPYLKQEFPKMNLRQKRVDYKLRINEGLSNLKEFLT